MFRSALLVLAFAAVCTAEAMDGGYIAVLNGNATDAAHAALSTKFGGSKIQIGAFRAVHVQATEAVLAMLHAEGDVKYIEENTMGHIMQACPAAQEEPVSWGTVRTTVSSAQDVLQVFAHNPQWGAGVDSYVLDTGVMCTHNDFTGRCTFGATFVGGNGNDGHGHGTHVAGTIGGTTWGISKQTQIFGVKVCTDGGSCPTAGVISAFEWVAQRYAQSGRPSVVNLSLGGNRNAAYNDATNALVALGVHVVAAAGNSNANTCTFSPASAEDCIAVGSTELGNQGGQQVDVRSPFSNWGMCTDVFAPGSAITSAGIQSNTAATTMSGTSMASPQVAGAVAQYLSQNPNATPLQAKNHIINSASANLILNPGNDSPNRMLHIQC